MLLGRLIKLPQLKLQLTSHLLLVILSALMDSNPFLFCNLSQYLMRKFCAILDKGDSQVVYLIDFLKRAHKRLLQALVLLHGRWLDLEVALEHEGGLVVIADDLGGAVVLLLEVVGVGLADFLLEPAEVVPPEGHRPRVLVEPKLIAK